MASAATSSESTTTDVIAPPNAVARAVSCSESIGAHNSAIVPMIPLISPRSRAPRIAAAPPAIPFEFDLFSNSARADRNCRSVSVIFFSTAADSSRRRDSERSASSISFVRDERSTVLPAEASLNSASFSSSSRRDSSAASWAFARFASTSSACAAVRSTSD